MSGDSIMPRNHSSKATSPKGIALPIALAAIVAVGALIAGVVFAATQEYRVSRNSVSAQQAHHAAEAGLSSMVASWPSRKADTLGVGRTVSLADSMINGAVVKREYTR